MQSNIGSHIYCVEAQYSTPPQYQRWFLDSFEDAEKLRDCCKAKFDCNDAIIICLENKGLIDRLGLAKVEA